MEGTVTGGTSTTSDNLTLDTSKERSFRERVEKYLRLSHQTLAEMLALRDEEDSKTKLNESPLQPNQPYYPYYPNNPIGTKWCPVSMGVCTNPFGDCINCPYHGSVTYNPGYTTTCTANLKDNNVSSSCSNIKDNQDSKVDTIELTTCCTT